ncbi:alpha carbonic anhydrase 1, chloroplastic-like [Andrographis paniculata]|uniref:alpha carbonic anhydrase 1, chloroplastic-like n=1 Tax=Andrographis paniculata TaxID=175694 RepID=UPI0021E72BDD|nr:alpha carbonic anhydrase 1, chloroplastic-like [Andrographis paniculata]
MAAAAAFALTTTLLIVGSYAVTTLKVDDDKPLQFTYSGDMGPDRWAALNPNFSLCAKGKSQSPIDIVTAQAVVNPKLKPLVREYNSVDVTLVDYKFTVGIEYPNHTGGIIFDGKKYSFKQMHWHSPSEHRINGRRFAAELHMVHVADDGQIAVVATLYKYGRPDPLLASIYSKLNEMAVRVGSEEKSPAIPFGPFHPPEIRRTPKKYYRYVGSFSAPPCTENIPYIVLAEELSISEEQVQALKGPLDMRCKNNARPSQPTNGRPVEAYEDHH